MNNPGRDLALGFLCTDIDDDTALYNVTLHINK